MLPFISISAWRPNGSRILCDGPVRTVLTFTRFVRTIGIRLHLIESFYLIIAIVFGKSNPHLLFSLTNLLYPAVAAVYNTIPNAFERNISSAIESAAQIIRTNCNPFIRKSSVFLMYRQWYQKRSGWI